MQLSAIAYNLKKYLRFVEKRSKSGAASMQANCFALKEVFQYILLHFKSLNFSLQTKLHLKIKALKRALMYLVFIKLRLVQRLPLL